MDLVSVVIPYFKKREYIQRCIQSVLVQNYQKFEIIIVYDGKGKVKCCIYPPWC